MDEILTYNEAVRTYTKVNSLNNLITPSLILSLTGNCTSGMSASKTTIAAANLVDYGDDFFNDKYFMYIARNDDSVGDAPEREYRRITNYVSSSGTFTTDAFSANVEEDDIIYIIHESNLFQFKNSSVYYGKTNADMVASGTSVSISSLAGFGDDFFNDKYWLKVIKNANSVGNAPEGSIRKIVDYTTAGVFSVDLFNPAIEANDEISVILGSTLPYFKKGVSCTITYPIYDADGDPVVNATSLDTEVSIDAASFIDATNEATQIGTSGIYSLLLTNSEMNGNIITIQTKTNSADAKTAVTTIYTAS